MYSNSILINGAILVAGGRAAEALTPAALATLMNWKVVALICNNAAIGIVTSLFLKVKLIPILLLLVQLYLLVWHGRPF